MINGENEMLRRAISLCLIALLCSGFAMAQEQKGADVNNHLPSNFQLGGAAAVCYGGPPINIPDNDPDGGITSSFFIPCPGNAISGLEVLVQISHTRVGDLEVALTHTAGPPVVILDRPGLQPPLPPPGSCCGCSSNDVDALFTDAGTAAAESMCNGVPPAISGTVVAGDPANPGLMAANFDGTNFCGFWELRVTDGAGQDTGSLIDWCVSTSGDAGHPVPASNRIAIFVLGALLILGSTYFMIRRRQTS